MALGPISLAGGEGGLDFGSAARSGDQQTNTSKVYNFAGPNYNKTDWTTVAIIGGVALIGLFVAKRLGVF